MTLAQADVRRLPLAAESVDLIFADPPYAKASLPCYEWLAREAARGMRGRLGNTAARKLSSPSSCR